MECKVKSAYQMRIENELRKHAYDFIYQAYFEHLKSLQVIKQQQIAASTIDETEES